MSALEGMHFVAGRAEPGGGEPFHGIDPKSGTDLKPAYRQATGEQIERAAQSAGAAAAEFAATTPQQRAALLRAIGDGLNALGDTLVERVTAETALPAARVNGERARTVLQLGQFADLIEEGSWVDARIDRAQPDRQPLAKPDLRRMLVPLGPVVVFGASNFPLAYSVAGGDTASSLAAGCPVIVKGHPAHPGTSELVGRVVHEAVQRLGLPAGTFSLLHGRSNALGAALVQHPAVQAVGFTGSHGGGRALFDLAARRAQPIPVFAEMGSANPVVVLPNALAGRGGNVAAALAASALLAQGQFCTSPGIVLTIDGPGNDSFAAVLRDKLTGAAAGPAVHPSIRTGYERALGEVKALPVTAVSTAAANGTSDVCPTLLSSTPAAVLENPRLRSEIYGPAVLHVTCKDEAELLAIVEAFDGHLTATVHFDGDDLASHQGVIAALRRRVGRLIANGVPTGVEVCPSMVHGGPYPAATDPRFSAVGTSSIQRWVRPACWQDWPQSLLPEELRDDNPRGIRRMIDGRSV